MRTKFRVLLIRPKYSSLVANLEPLGLEYLAGLARRFSLGKSRHPAAGLQSGLPGHHGWAGSHIGRHAGRIQQTDFTPYKGSDAYNEYRNKLRHFRSWRLDGTHLTLKPTNMSSLEFMFRYYLIHAQTYPKVVVRSLFGTAYDTKKTGWI